MKRQAEELSAHHIQYSKHLILEEDQSLFVEILPETLDPVKAELVGPLPIKVSNDVVAIKKLVLDIKDGNWQPVLATHYYPQLAMAAYLQDFLSLEEVQTALFMYSLSVHDGKIEISAQSIDLPKADIDGKEETLLEICRRYESLAAFKMSKEGATKFVEEFFGLPKSQRAVFIYRTAAVIDALPSEGIINLYLKCLPTEIRAKPIQGRLGYLTTDDIEHSVRRNQRYIGFSYPGSFHFPAFMIDSGLFHDYGHFVQQLRAPQIMLDLAFHLVDLFREVTSVKWSTIQWSLIDSALHYPFWDKTSEESLIDFMKDLQRRGANYAVAIILLDIIANEAKYLKFVVNPSSIYQQLLPMVEERLLEHFRKGKNCYGHKLLTLTALLLLPEGVIIRNDFELIRFCNELEKNTDPRKISFLRKKIDDTNMLVMYYEKQALYQKKFVEFLELLGCAELNGYLDKQDPERASFFANSSQSVLSPSPNSMKKSPELP